MGRFIFGAFFASLIWCGGIWVYQSGYLEEVQSFLNFDFANKSALFDDDQQADEDASRLSTAKKKPTKRKARKKKKHAATRTQLRGRSTVGDALGRAQSIDFESSKGEEQLSGAKIDQAFDKAMPSLRKCFYLAEGEVPDGTLRFGLRIEANGHVSRSNLSGPNALVKGQPGRCLRDAAERIRFPAFDGAAMRIKYPIRLML